MNLSMRQPMRVVSCFTAGCEGCDWPHHEPAGHPKFYTEVRIPRWVYRKLRNLWRTNA